MDLPKHYHVDFDLKARKILKKLDKSIQDQLLLWLNKNIEGTENPREKGKGLTSNKSGLWRYRVGKYRIICDIQGDVCLVLVINAGERATIFD
jgi:mRNA interferase RelE/StbE